MRQVIETRGAFDSAEYASRVGRVRAEMRAQGLDALVVSTPENIYYLVGLSHQGYFAVTLLVLPLEGTPIIVTRAMERHTISKQAPDVIHLGYEEGDDAGTAGAQAVRQAGCTEGRIGVDTSSMFFPPGVWGDLEAGLPGVAWVDTSRSSSVQEGFRAGFVDNIRLVKSDAEVAYLRQAAAISDRAVRAGLGTAGVGVNEREVAAAVYQAMILGGGEYPGFAPLIRSTETLMEEHSTWRNRLLEPGDKLFVELSASAARYHAPLGRMAYIARSPHGAARAHEIATDALEAARVALRPGVRTGDVYRAWQDVVDEGLGHGRLRRHHCGYSVGIGFPPSWVGSSTVLGIRPGGKVRIRAGMAFHLWAWITDTDLGDYLVSDSALVTEAGTELLTTTPRTVTID